MPQNNQIIKDFREFIVLLNQFRAEYLVIGGFAMAAHGHIRATNDLDIFINASKTNAHKMMQVCDKFGIPKGELNSQMFLVKKMVRIGEFPFRIEILKALAGIDFQYAYDRAVETEVDGTKILTMSAEDLLVVKKDALKSRSEPRDQEDVDFLTKKLGK